MSNSLNLNIREWLKSIDLEEYVQLFISNNIDYEILLTIDGSDLKEMGINSLGHRKKILNFISEIKNATPAENVFMDKKPIKIFISYGHDKSTTEMVDRIVIDLKKNGFEIWIDKENIKFGNDWRTKILEGIKSSSHVIAFLSNHSVRKPGVCREEIAIAIGHLKGQILTILVEHLDNVKPPLLISHLQWLDMHEWKNLEKNNPKKFLNWYQESINIIVKSLKFDLSFEGDIQKLKNWLKPIEYNADILTFESEFSGRDWLLAGIGESLDNDKTLQAWELGEIEKWRTDGSDNRVFFITAPPGWGKSAVVARLAHIGRNRVLAVHFCRHDMPLRNNPNQIVRNVVFQIATQLADYRKNLLNVSDICPDLFQLSPIELFDILLIQPIQNIINGNRSNKDKYLIAFDGLDETINSEGHSVIIETLTKLISRLPNWVGLLITSRPESLILNSFSSFGIHIQLYNDKNNLVDIRNYAKAKILNQKFSDHDKKLVLENILLSANGCFLYVNQILDALNNGVLTLQELKIKSCFPQTLTSFYLHWFNRIFVGNKKWEDYGRSFIEVIAASFEPVSLNFMTELLDLDIYLLRSCVDIFGSLLRHENGKTTFFHKSFWDWITNYELAGKWYVDIKNCDRKIFEKVNLACENQLKLRDEYFEKNGALHCIRFSKPEIGALYLGARSNFNHLNAKNYRLTVEIFFEYLSKAPPEQYCLIPLNYLSKLLMCTDSKSSEFICDLIVSRNPNMYEVFKDSPLDGNGATWVFASRWASHIIKNFEKAQDNIFIELGKIATEPLHPVHLPAAYTFKYIAIKKQNILKLNYFEPLCLGWTYSRLVAANTLLQLTLKGSNFPTMVPWEDFWFPVWEYNQIEVDLLAGAMIWKGLTCPRKPSKNGIEVFTNIENERQYLFSKITEKSLRDALDFYWDAASDLNLCKKLLRAIVGVSGGDQVLNLFLKSPLFEASDIASSVTLIRIKHDHNSYKEYVQFAINPLTFSWGLFQTVFNHAISIADENTISELIKSVILYGDAQLRGLCAMLLSGLFRDANSGERVLMYNNYISYLRSMINDNDIWPVQEIYHLMRDIEIDIKKVGIDWIDDLVSSGSPVLSLFDEWRSPDCSVETFEANATFAKKKKLR